MTFRSDMVNGHQLHALVQEIHDAFSVTPYPGDDAIVDLSVPHIEKEEIRRFFRGKNWREIALEALVSQLPVDHSACLWFMENEAVRYYLPAFMLIALEKFEESELIPDQVVHMLTPDTTSGSKYDEFLALVSPLTPSQKRAVAHFLEYMRDQHENEISDPSPSVALQRYWTQFL